MRKRVPTVICALAGVLWAVNSSWLASPSDPAAPRLLAHRGVHQIYAGSDRSTDACHAAPIVPADHSFIENTLPSINAAFELGAEVVEIDIHLTPDGQFAVFHDWTLDCKTDASGVTRKTPMSQLRDIDPGSGYSTDGQTFPLRGLWRGTIPTLTEVLEAAPEGPLLINFKSRDADEGQALADLIAKRAGQAQLFGVYGGANPTRAAMDALPGLPGYDKQSIKSCLIAYAALGWSGHVPKACQTGLIAVPVDIGGWLWGWPHRFTQRMAMAGTKVILLGPYDGSGFSSGIDDEKTLGLVPKGFDGFIWTNRIEWLGPKLGE